MSRSRLASLFISGAFFAVLVLFGFFVPHGNAQTPRSYEYESINFHFQVRPDTTVDVNETQTYKFNGEYHQAVRFISKNKISSINDIFVADNGTGELLEYSSRRLDKTDPSSWNKFTTYSEGGAYYIEWYYDATDTTRSWQIEYTLHGALSFHENIDELYWDLFDAYDVPVRRVTASVTLPENEFSKDEYQLELYTLSAVATSAEITDDKSFVFYAEDVPPGEPVTIAAGWPRGIVDRGAFWRGLAFSYWGLISAFILVLAAIIYALIHWYRSEVSYKGKRTIVPEYAPPRGLRPAMMDVIVNEKITPRALPATIVDLAVHGYIKIKEEPQTKLTRVFKSIRPAYILLIPLAMILFGIIPLVDTILIVFSLLIFFMFFSFLVGQGRGSKDYIVTKTQTSEEPTEQYEKEFLDILFAESKEFSTREMKKLKMQSRAQEMYKATQKLREELLKETDFDTRAYAVPPIKWKTLHIIRSGGIIGALFLLSFLSSISAPQILLVVIGVFVSAILVYTQRKFNPMLNMEGNRLREQCLGFKLYLKTAERDRLQNLTPELFEKYLPYAMVFGVEKKWAKAFESIHMSPPSWYSGSGVGYVSGGGASSTPTFSASAFSASFSSSFSSAFSSSAGGGGASGGGGGAGGGGGGGGGGAS